MLPSEGVHDGIWDGGWYLGARRMPSPNFGPRPAETEIDLLVIHSISLPPGHYGGDEVELFFTNQLDWDAHPYFNLIRGVEVSAHFFLRRTGDLVQFVDCGQRAWHAGASTHQGRVDCNSYSIGIELEGLEGDQFDARQYDRLAVLCRHLAKRFPISDIAGHEHVAPGRKADPGPGFDWDILAKQLEGIPLQLPDR